MKAATFNGAPFLVIVKSMGERWASVSMQDMERCMKAVLCGSAEEYDKRADRCEEYRRATTPARSRRVYGRGGRRKR